MKNLIRIVILILQGFTYKTAREYIRYRQIYKNKNKYTVKEIMSILPINKTFDKMFGDLLSIRVLLTEYREYLPKYYCMTLRRNSKLIFCSLDEKSEPYSVEEIIDLVKFLKAIEVKNVEYSNDGNDWVCRYSNGSYYIDDKPVSEAILCDKINKLPQGYLIAEFTEGKIFEITTINECGYPFIASKLSELDSLNRLVLNIAENFPEIEYMNFSMRVKERRVTITKIETGIDLLRKTDLESEVIGFVDRKLAIKCDEKIGVIKTVKRYMYSYIAQKKGFVDYMYKNWQRGKKEDRNTRSVSFTNLLWAHRRGFYSYRIEQYGLTEENYKEFLSDYDYKRLRPINNMYRKWLWDKLTLFYILKKFDIYLPEYYYHIAPNNGNSLILKKQGCPDKIEASVNGIINLLEDKKKLVLKPVIGSHGEGFYKLEFTNNQYAINDQIVHVNRVKELIESFDNNYLITEYVEMHKKLKRIYSKVACTIRIMVINRNGYDPVIENAYFRIGTAGTGQTDNIAYGGIFAHVDEISGEIENPRIIKKHVIRKCEYHPDSGEKIEGNIPFWDDICDKIIEISRYIFPVEYMGFDIVVTDKGFKVLEINTHQDLHRYPEYNENVKEYFKEKQKTLT